MESHIERLTAACGLRHFIYRAFGAPEIVIEQRAQQPEVLADLEPEVDSRAESAMPTDMPTPAMMPAPAAAPLALPLALPLAPPLALPLAAVPPIRLSQPPEDQATASSLPLRRAPVVLPPPDAPVIAAAARPARPVPSGRPPVVLPDPESFDPIIDFRRREARPAPDRRAAPPVPAATRRDAPPRRFALLDEIAPSAAPPPRAPDRRAPPPISPGRP